MYVTISYHPDKNQRRKSSALSSVWHCTVDFNDIHILHYGREKENLGKL